MPFLPLKMFCCGYDVIELMRGAASGSNYSLIRESMWHLHSADHTQRVSMYDAEVDIVYERRKEHKKLQENMPEEKLRAWGALKQASYSDKHVDAPEMHLISGNCPCVNPNNRKLVTSCKLTLPIVAVALIRSPIDTSLLFDILLFSIGP